MYALDSKVIAKGIGLCTVHGRTYEERTRYLLKDRLGKLHPDVPAHYVRAYAYPETTTPVSCGHSVQFIKHPLELVK